MEAIAAQWPLLVPALGLSAALAKVIQSQYERMLKDRDKVIDTLTVRLDAMEKNSEETAAALKELVALVKADATPRSRRTNGGD